MTSKARAMSYLDKWTCRPRVGLTGLCAVGVLWMASGSLLGQETTTPTTDKAATTTVDEATEESTGAPIYGCDEPTFDFGDFWAGPKRNHTFVIKNTGTEVLKILKVKPSCGCTLAGSYTKEIAPGETGEIPCSLATKNLGRSKKKFTKRVTVTTNDPDNTTVILNLTGLAKAPVDMTPASVQFGNVKMSAELTRTVQITNNLEEPMTLTLKPTPKGKFKAELVEVEAGKKFELVITGTPPYDEGRNLTKFSLSTNLADQPTLTISAYASVAQRFQLSKKIIYIPRAQSTESSHSISFSNNGDTPVTILSAEVVGDASVTTTIDEREAGKRYLIQVTFPPDYLPPLTGAKLVLHTDDAQKPTMDIPVRRKPAKTKTTRPKRPAELMVGKKAPSIQLQTVSGKPINTGNPDGKVMVLDFWASWCGFCKKQIPVLQEIYEEYKDNPDIEFVAVSLDTEQGRRATTPQKVKDKFASLGAKFDLVLDSSKSAGTPFKATSFPTLFLIGKSGTIEAVHPGFRASTFKKAVKKDIDALLAGKTLAQAPATKTPTKTATLGSPLRAGSGKPASVGKGSSGTD